MSLLRLLFCDDQPRKQYVKSWKQQNVKVKEKFSHVMVSAPKRKAPIDSKKNNFSKAFKALSEDSWKYKSYSYRNPDLLQPSNQTKENRLPIIYDKVKELVPTAKRILSFGCSTGSETTAISSRYGSDVEIIGYDISYSAILQARSKNKAPNIYFHDELEGTGKFDAILCCMVLFCLEKEVDKDKWNKALLKMDQRINQGGIIFIYTSDYNPSEVFTTDKYEHLNEWVRKHNKKPDGKDYFNGYYKKK